MTGYLRVPEMYVLYLTVREKLGIWFKVLFFSLLRLVVFFKEL